MSRQEWDRLAKTFEADVCDITTTSGDRLAELVRAARPSRRRTLVDAGCGIGSFTKRFGKRYGQAVAFDFAPRMVRRAKKRCAALSHVEWSTLGLEDAAAKFGPIGDLTVCLNVVTSTDARLRERQWASLAGLTKPGGHVLVVVPSVESALYVMQHAGESNEIHRSQPEQSLFVRGDDPQKHYTRGELRKTLWCHGLRAVSLRRILYPWTEEGLDELPAAKPPWDWVYLARKSTRRRGDTAGSPSKN